jgi:hypothetical protein
MLRFLADENLNNRILRGLARRRPDLDLVRVQDVGLLGEDDPTILAWAAEQGRILLTHDVSTMTRFVNQRLRAGEPVHGVFEVPYSLPVGQAIDEILLADECSDTAEWEGLVLYLPL